MHVDVLLRLHVSAAVRWHVSHCLCALHISLRMQETVNRSQVINTYAALAR